MPLLTRFVLPAALLASGLIAVAQDREHASPGRVSQGEYSGVEMYRTHCATCHGTDGKGLGPAAPALKTAPSDLTQISKNNGGQFPGFRITHIVDGSDVIAVHGSREMPVWGNYFRDNNSRDEALLKLREHNLTEYIRSIQQK